MKKRINERHLPATIQRFQKYGSSRLASVGKNRLGKSHRQRQSHTLSGSLTCIRMGRNRYSWGVFWGVNLN
jgi:hypothetical protein